MLNLKDIKQGKTIKLESISDKIRANLIRMGICTGDLVKCIANIPGGPVVVSKGLQEVAIGESFAKDIEVSLEK